MASFHKVLAIKPDYTEAHYNLGNALKHLGWVEGTVGSYWRALEIDPDYIKAHHNLGLALLLKGNQKEGWMNYHWRFRVDEGGAQQRLFNPAPLAGLGSGTETIDFPGAILLNYIIKRMPAPGRNRT